MEPAANENSPMRILNPSEPGSSISITPQGQPVDRVNREALAVMPGFTREDWTLAAKMIKAAFPKVDEEWLTMFSLLVREEGYSGEQLIASVKHAIKTTEYNHTMPPVARFMDQSNRVKLLSYYDVEKDVHKGDNWKNFRMIAIIEGLAYFARQADVIRYNLKPYGDPQ